jgi:DNA-3-methyladenine glycosylase I
MRDRATIERMRCAWARREPASSYHDAEWGVPEHDNRRLFELLSLEGAQAGLSWDTILRKRDGYRAAFAGFDPAVVARFDEAKIDALVHDPGIVRHRGKIAAAVRNAALFLDVQREHGSFAAFLWAYVDGVPVVTRRADSEALPATTPLSDRISGDLRELGFGFVGPTIVYAFLQATGVVDDHIASCYRSTDVAERGRRPNAP